MNLGGVLNTQRVKSTLSSMLNTTAKGIEMTLSEALKGKTIVFIDDEDYSVLIRLDDGTEIVINDGVVRKFDDTGSAFYYDLDEEEGF